MFKINRSLKKKDIIDDNVSYLIQNTKLFTSCDYNENICNLLCKIN